MFGLSELKQTKVYQEAKQEGREERDQEIMSKMIPKFLSLNWTVEQISQFLELDVKQVQQFLERSRKH
jgi:predicted transposase YdaD